MSARDELLESIAAAVKEGSEEETVSRCARALGEGIPARDIAREGLCRGMHQAGDLYEAHLYFLPELLLASEAMHAGIQALVPSLQGEDAAAERETVVLGVVEGDVHDIGKNLVGVMLEAEGYKVVDLGCDVSPRRFVDEVGAGGAQVLALSTMMTTTVPAMRRTVELARELEPRPLIIVGGAPLSGGVAADMGADGYGENSARAPGLIRSLLG